MATTTKPKSAAAAKKTMATTPGADGKLVVNKNGKPYLTRVFVGMDAIKSMKAISALMATWAPGFYELELDCSIAKKNATKKPSPMH